MIACPNKNNKDWKLIESNFGEDIAYLIYVTNNYDIPDLTYGRATVSRGYLFDHINYKFDNLLKKRGIPQFLPKPEVTPIIVEPVIEEEEQEQKQEPLLKKEGDLFKYLSPLQKQILAHLKRVQAVEHTVRFDSEELDGDEEDDSFTFGRVAGQYRPGKKEILLRNTDSTTIDKIAKTYIHEYTHAVFIGLHRSLSINSPVYKDLEYLYNRVKDLPNLKYEYGLTNIDEFFAEAFSNKEFQAKLSTVLVNRSELKTKDIPGNSITDSIFNFLKELIGRAFKFTTGSKEQINVLKATLDILFDVSESTALKEKSKFLINTSAEFFTKFDTPVPAVNKILRGARNSNSYVELSKFINESFYYYDTTFKDYVKSIFKQAKALNISYQGFTKMLSNSEYNSIEQTNNTDLALFNDEGDYIDNFLGGYSEKGTFTRQGNAKDQAMRQFAVGFVGEIHPTKSNKFDDPMYNSFRYYFDNENKKETTRYLHRLPANIGRGDVVILGVAEDINDDDITDEMKATIRDLHAKGVRFILNDRPATAEAIGDNTITTYLDSIGAPYVVYGHGMTNRLDSRDARKYARRRSGAPLTKGNKVGKDPNLGKLIERNEVNSIIKRLLPRNAFRGVSLKDKQMAYEFVDTLVIRGKKAWGALKDGIIKLEKIGGKDATYIQVLKHEVFHEIWTNYLSDKEKANITKIALEKYKSEIDTYLNNGYARNQDEAIQEVLARKYQTQEFTSKSIRNTFYKIGVWLGFVKRNVSNIDNLFKAIDGGVFIKPTQRGYGDDLAIRKGDKFIVDRFTNLNAYRNIKEIIKLKFFDYENKGYSGQRTAKPILLPKHEAKDVIFEDLKRLLKQYSREYKFHKDIYDELLAVTQPYNTDSLIFDINDILTGNTDVLDKLPEDIQATANDIVDDYFDFYTDAQGETVVPESISDTIHKLNEQIINLRGAVRSKEFYNSLIQDIYPKYANFDPTDVEAKDSEEAIADDQSEASVAKDSTKNSIVAETINNAQRNMETSVSANVKDVLSNIKIGEGIMNWRYAYLKMLQIMEGLKPGAPDFAKQLERRQDEMGNDIYTEAVVKTLLANLDVLNKTIFSVKNKDGKEDNIELPRNIKFFGTDMVVMSRGSLSEINNVEELKQRVDIRPEDIIDRKSFNNSREFYFEIDKRYFALTGQRISYTVLNRLYKKERAADFFASVVNNFNSLIEKDFRIIETKLGKDGSRLSMSYITGQSIGVRQSVQAQMVDVLSTIETHKELMEFTASAGFTGKAESNKEQFEELKSLLNELGVGQYIETIPYNRNSEVLKEQVSQVYTNLTYLFEFHLAELGQVKVKKEEDENAISEEQDLITLDELLNNNTNALKSVANMLASYNGNNVATSVKDLEGKRKYAWQNSSFLATTIKRISKMGKKIKSITLPIHLQGEFYQKHNIFIPTATKDNYSYIDSFIEHEGAKEESQNGDIKPTPYNKENFLQFMERHFMGGFLLGLKNSPESRPSYIQYFFPFSNRPLMYGANVKILDKEDQLKGYRSMVAQYLDRPDYSQELDKYDKYSFNQLNDLKLTYEKEAGKSLTNQEAHDLIAKDGAWKAAKKLYTYMVEVVTPRFTQKFIRELEANTYNRFKGTSNIGKKFTKDLFKMSSKLDSTKHLDRYIDKKLATSLGATSEVNMNSFMENMQPLLAAFLINDNINSYFLNQLGSNDFAFYGDGLTLNKRYQIITAPGSIMFTGKGGARQTFNVAVAKEFEYFVDSMEDGSIKKMLFEVTGEMYSSEQLKIWSKSFDPTDGQAYTLPERVADLGRGLGVAYNVGDINKGVFGAQNISNSKNPIATSLKYSTAALSAEYVKGKGREKALFIQLAMRNFGLLKAGLLDEYNDLVKAIESNNYTPKQLNRYIELDNLKNRTRIDELVLESGVKYGRPKTKTKIQDALKETSDENFIKPESVMVLPNSEYIVQLNPTHIVHREEDDNGVAIFTQLMYFLNILDGNVEQAKTAYGAVSDLMKQGMNRVNELISDKDKLKDAIVDSYTEVIGQGKAKTKIPSRGNERTWELTRELGLNFPGVVNSNIIKLTKLFEKYSVNIRFPGKKLTLVSSQFITKPNGERLKYKTKIEGGVESILYAETIIPRGILTVAQEKVIDEANEAELPVPDTFLFNDTMGFRIPSTELHSAVPLKVVGFYDSKGTNGVHVPMELVPLHGSDFDVDSLFILTREYHTVSPLGEDDPLNGMFEKEVPIGYTKTENGFELIPNYKSKLEKLYGIDSLTDKRLDVLKTKFLKNTILETMLETISAYRNRKRIMSPITMVTLQEVAAELKSYGSKGVENNVNMASIEGRWDVYNSAFSGALGTGVFANGVKTLSYMIRSGKGGSLPSFKNKKRKITIGNYTTNSLQQYEKGDTTKTTVWEVLDAFINAAIDNVKAQLLLPLNATTATFAAYIAGIGMGVPLKTMAYLINQPVFKGGDYEVQLKIAMDRVSMKPFKVTEKDKQSLTDEHLIKYLKEDIATSTDEGFIKTQFIASTIFKQLTAVGDNLTDVSRVLSVVRSFPITAAGLDGYMELYKKFFGEKANTLFDMQEFRKSLPHIDTAFDIASTLQKTNVDVFYKNHPNLYYLTEQLGYKIRLDRLDEHVSNETVRNEFIKYVLAGLDWDPTFSYKNETKYESASGYTTSNEIDNFNNNLIQQLRLLKQSTGIVNNRLIENLYSQFNKGTNSKQIRFSAGSNLEIADLIEFEQDFRELNKISFTKEDGQWVINRTEEPTQQFSKFQRDLLRYAVNTYGLSYGITNYTMAIPTELLAEVNNAFEAKMKYLLELDSKEFAGKFDAFKLQLALFNPNRIQGSKQVYTYKSQKKDVYDGFITNKGLELEIEGQIVQGDLAYKKVKTIPVKTSDKDVENEEDNFTDEEEAEVDNTIIYPMILPNEKERFDDNDDIPVDIGEISGNNTSEFKLYVKTFENEDYVFYKDYGKKPKNTAYRYIEDYDIFSIYQGDNTILLYNNIDPILKSGEIAISNAKAEYIKEGEFIYLTSDPLAINLKQVRVTKIVKKGELDAKGKVLRNPIMYFDTKAMQDFQLVDNELVNCK